jgi:hypothetical protein
MMSVIHSVPVTPAVVVEQQQPIITTTNINPLLIESLANLVVCLAGAELTEQDKNKSFSDRLYVGVFGILKNKRIPTALRDEIMKREHTFEPHFTLGPVQNHHFEQLSIMFPEHADSAKIEEVMKLFKAIQKACRHEWGPIYQKAEVSRKSGVNNDTDSLNIVVQLAEQEKQVLLYGKAVSKALTKFQALHRDATTEEIATRKKQEQDKRWPTYQVKINNANLKTTLHPWMLAFVLLGVPGLNMAGLVARVSATSDSRVARKAVKQLENTTELKIKMEQQAENQIEKRRQADELMKIKGRELELKERALKLMEISESIKSCKEMLEMLESDPPSVERDEEIKVYKAQLRDFTRKKVALGVLKEPEPKNVLERTGMMPPALDYATTPVVATTNNYPGIRNSLPLMQPEAFSDRELVTQGAGGDSDSEPEMNDDESSLIPTIMSVGTPADVPPAPMMIPPSVTKSGRNVKVSAKAVNASAPKRQRR